MKTFGQYVSETEKSDYCDRKYLRALVTLGSWRDYGSYQKYVLANSTELALPVDPDDFLFNYRHYSGFDMALMNLVSSAYGSLDELKPDSAKALVQSLATLVKLGARPSKVGNSRDVYDVFRRLSKKLGQRDDDAAFFSRPTRSCGAGRMISFLDYLKQELRPDKSNIALVASWTVRYAEQMIDDGNLRELCGVLKQCQDICQGILAQRFAGSSTMTASQKIVNYLLLGCGRENAKIDAGQASYITEMIMVLVDAGARLDYYRSYSGLVRNVFSALLELAPDDPGVQKVVAMQVARELEV